ncbi:MULTISPECIES: hypothetical protein [unclassified Kribbella]|uniref:hypothetical protein n=1 Tax=unclassified Kribbella TaxID=2644121 RepID=UPI0033D20688
MTDDARSEAAALVIRVWRETAERSGIRARITRRPDLADERQTTMVVASPEEVYREVRVWLEHFLEQSSRDS